MRTTSTLAVQHPVTPGIPSLLVFDSFVDGKSQTKMPWDSWKRPYTIDPPLVWFHDVLHTDGKPYREREAELLRQYGSRKR